MRTIELTLNEIIYATEAQVEGVVESQTVNQICTDTRELSSGCLFVALKGDNFDGHDYVEKALESGAVAVVVEKPVAVDKEKEILVEDTRLALLQIAGVWRSKLDVKVVAITGSVGKTTTKEMTYNMLATAGKTFKTKANLNNEIGLSQMLLALNNDYKYAVLEIGVDGPGQMIDMALAAMPNVAIITNVGLSHIEAFGTIKEICKEKMDILDGVIRSGKVILNGDDPCLKQGTKKRSALYFALDSLSAEIQARDIVYENDYTDFELHYQNTHYHVRLPIAGKHNVYNALAAFGASVTLDIEPEVAAKALEDYTPEGMRQHMVEHNGYTIVEDCYNAGPQSMRAAVDTLSGMKTDGGRKIAVFSDMLELGKDKEKLHLELGRDIARSGIDALFLVGELSKNTEKGALDSGFKEVFYFADKDKLTTAILEYAKPKDIVWFKASRGMRLEDIIGQIYKEN